MAISVSCPACGHQYNVMDEAAGKKFRCKHCEAIVEVPSAGGPASEDLSRPEEQEDPFGHLDFGPATGDTELPRRRSTSTRPGTGSSSNDRLNGPAIGLMITGGIGIAGALFLAFIFAIGATVGPPAGQNMGQAEMMIGFGFWFVMLFVQFITSCFVIFGAVKMNQGKSYGVALASSIIASIPCMTPCICMPFGIWALVVLNDDAVKAAFR